MCVTAPVCNESSKSIEDVSTFILYYNFLDFCTFQLYLYKLYNTKFFLYIYVFSVMSNFTFNISKILCILFMCIVMGCGHITIHKYNIYSTWRLIFTEWVRRCNNNLIFFLLTGTLVINVGIHYSWRFWTHSKISAFEKILKQNEEIRNDSIQS